MVELIFLIVSLGLRVGFGLEAVLTIPGCFYCWAGLAQHLLCPPHLPTPEQLLAGLNHSSNKSVLLLQAIFLLLKSKLMLHFSTVITFTGSYHFKGEMEA